MAISLTRCVRRGCHERLALPFRTFSASSAPRLETEKQAPTSSAPPPSPPQDAADLNPELVSLRAEERELFKATRQHPIASRRRRAVLKQMQGSAVPFEHLPYQCFQEARKVLLEDRQEKLEEIRRTREKITRITAQDVPPQDEDRREQRLHDLRRTLGSQKILADVNDPLTKKKFEDGMGDLRKPIYRYMADRKWRQYKRKLLVQRIYQMKVVPDILPSMDPVLSTDLSCSGRKISHGEVVDSRLSEPPPKITIQPFDKGERLITIAVVNPDVPSVAKDDFDRRCHFLALNVPISPINTLVDFAKLDERTQIVQPWLPAYSQKGLPYQRMAICILEQPPKDTHAPSEGNETRSQTLDVEALKSRIRDSGRENFALRSFMASHRLKPVGIDLFRTVFDEGTADVMKRAGIVGWDLEFKRKRIEALPYKRLSEARYR